MSYAQTMRWHKKHPTGGKPQYMGFATGSGFWPSVAFTDTCWIPYLDACEAIGTQPIKEQDFYTLTLSGRIMSGMTDVGRAQYTQLLRLRAIREPDNAELKEFR